MFKSIVKFIVTRCVKFVIDDEDDIGVSFFGGFFVLIKYKEHVVPEWFRPHYRSAPRYVGIESTSPPQGSTAGADRLVALGWNGDETS